MLIVADCSALVALAICEGLALLDQLFDEVKVPLVIASGGIGQGELEAMALYKTLHANYLLVDDKRARKVARLNHIKITGSQGILLLAKHEGLISRVQPFLDRLRHSDIRISERLIHKTLQLAESIKSCYFAKDNLSYKGKQRVEMVMLYRSYPIPRFRERWFNASQF